MTTVKNLILSSPGLVDPTNTVSAASSITQQVTVTLTQTQINTMFTTPITLVAAQGAGTVILPQSVTVKVANGGTAFTGGGALALAYAGGVGTITQSTAIAAAVVINTSTTAPSYGATALAYASVSGSDLRNAAVTLSNGTAVFAGGAASATMQVTLTYTVLTGQ
jgi:hypothetical protein